MNRNLVLFSFLLAVVAVGCKKELRELGDPPTDADAQFTYVATSESDNIIEFSASRKDVVSVWDFGNGTEGKGSVARGIYPKAGTYTVVLTVFSSGGSASSTQDIVIEEDDLSLLNSPLFTFLTDGSTKTWVIDSNNTGHFGVGPNPASSLGFVPEWYAAESNEKKGAGFYDDRYTFTLDGFLFDMITNGDVYVNAEHAADFPGSYESPVSDYIAPFENQTGETWTITTEEDTLLSVSGSSFLGYYSGTRVYQIVRINKNELTLRYEDTKNSAHTWYIRLVPDYLDTGDGGSGGGGGGGGGGDTTKTDGASLPIDFESDPPVFEAFGGSTDTVVNNPDASGINTSNTVLETEHGNETWAGIFVDLKEAFNFSTEKSIAVKIWAPQTGKMRIKLEDSGDDTKFVEKDVDVTKSNEWIEVSIDFSDATPDLYDRLVLFPGWEVANAGTFYLDDIVQK